MSIQNQIDRIEQAKADIGTSIAGKGVTVPSGTQIDGLSALIDQIATGGSNIPATITAGDTPIMANWTGKQITAKSATATGCKLTITKSGTYRFKIPACAAGGYMGGGSPTVYLYKNGAQSNSTTVSSSTVTAVSFDVQCAVGDEIEVYGMAAGSTYSTTNLNVLGLIACIEWDNGF